MNEDSVSFKDEEVISENPEITKEEVLVEEQVEIKEELPKEEIKALTGSYTTVTDTDDEFDESTIKLPTLPTNVLMSYMLQSSDIDNTYYASNPDNALAVMININSLPFIVNEDYYKNFRPSDKIKSFMEHNGKNIKFEELEVKSGSKKNIAINKLRSITRLGKNVQIPLWNSGFRVTLSVANTNALYELKKKLRDTNIESDVDTGGLLFSSKKIKLNKEVLDFISAYIVDSTLDVPNDKTIYDFIKIEDISLLITGLSLSFYPDGINVNVTCTNTGIFKDGLPKCNFFTGATINPRDLIKIDSSRITDTMLDIISRRNSKSVSIEDLETYRNEFIKEGNDTAVLEYENGDLETKLYNPVISEYLEKGNVWYDMMLDSLYGLGNLKPDLRKEELDNIMDLNILGSYAPYVKSIMIEEEEYNDDEIILETFNELSQDDHTCNVFIKRVIDFISYNTIANIGTNNYICPNCQKKQKEEGLNPFELEYIWLDPISYFLEILNLKLIKMQKRMES